MFHIVFLHFTLAHSFFCFCVLKIKSNRNIVNFVYDACELNSFPANFTPRISPLHSNCGSVLCCGTQSNLPIFICLLVISLYVSRIRMAGEVRHTTNVEIYT